MIDILKYTNEVHEAIKGKSKWKKLYHLIIVPWYWRLRIGGYKRSWFWKIFRASLINDPKIIKAIMQGKI